MRRTRLLFSMVTIFVFCWLPLNILNLAEDLDLPLKTWRWVLTLQYHILKQRIFSHSETLNFERGLENLFDILQPHIDRVKGNLKLIFFL